MLDTPVIYSDGVINQVMGPGICKFYLLRNDAVPGDVNVYQKNVVAQIVMPSQAFVDMVAFFEHRLRVMVATNNIPKEMVEERRAFYNNYPVE